MLQASVQENNQLVFGLTSVFKLQLQFRDRQNRSSSH